MPDVCVLSSSACGVSQSSHTATSITHQSASRHSAAAVHLRSTVNGGAGVVSSNPRSLSADPLIRHKQPNFYDQNRNNQFDSNQLGSTPEQENDIANNNIANSRNGVHRIAEMFQSIADAQRGSTPPNSARMSNNNININNNNNNNCTTTIAKSPTRMAKPAAGTPNGQHDNGHSADEVPPNKAPVSPRMSRPAVPKKPANLMPDVLKRETTATNPNAVLDGQEPVLEMVTKQTNSRPQSQTQIRSWFWAELGFARE